MKHIKTFESYINESINASFQDGMEKMIDNIKSGMGWIDPYYVEDSYFAMQKEEGYFFGIPFNAVKRDIYIDLMKADLLYFAKDDDGEEKGKKVTNLSQI